MTEDPDRDLLAGEYVLGALEGEARRAAERRIEQDPDFARAVADWQTRLLPLAAMAAPVAPPAELWDRIAATTNPSARRPVGAATAERTPASGTTSLAARQSPPRRGLRFWQASTAGALALAAALAGIMVLRQPGPAGLAVLQPKAGGPALLAIVSRRGEFVVRPTGTLAAVPPGREMELWALPAGAHAPRALGALPVTGQRMSVSLSPGTEIMVSLEPAGGSPTGGPTGPVLYAGRLERL